MKKVKQLVDFGEAVKALKEGKRVQRQGWNGKGLFIAMQVPSDINVKDIVPKMQSLPQSVKDEFAKRLKSYEKSPNTELRNFRKTATSIHYRNQLIMVYPDNYIYGWVASPSDILEEDWIILD